MITLLITSVLLLGLIALAVYFWQKPSNSTVYPELPPPSARGLFESAPATDLLPSENNDQWISEIRLRASQGDQSALSDAKKVGLELYDEVLNKLLSKPSEGQQLLSLVSYITRHELPVNSTLAKAFMQSWRLTPDRNSTAKMLHVSALSDAAKCYCDAVELALGFWREGKIPDLSATELQALLTGEFWVLSSGTRSSGAGFLVKRTLSSARRELEASNNR